MTEQSTRQQHLNAASGAATKRLREAHPEEWNDYMLEEANARGEKWSPKLTPEQKAEAEFEKLLAEHPHLASKVVPTMPQAPPEDPA